MIVLDNAIECCFRSFVLSEKRLVGKHKLIKPSQWANDAESFVLVMDHAYNNSSSTSLPEKTEVLHYHDTRNTLYHREKSISVSTSVIKKYLVIAKVLLKELFGFSTTDEAWAAQVKAVRNAFLSKPAEILLPVAFQKDDGKVRVDGVQSLTQREIIAITLHCFSTVFARTPTLDEVVGSMTVSGVSINKNTLAVQLTYLKKANIIKKKVLAITNSHRKKLVKEYVFKRL